MNNTKLPVVMNVNGSHIGISDASKTLKPDLISFDITTGDLKIIEFYNENSSFTYGNKDEEVALASNTNFLERISAIKTEFHCKDTDKILLVFHGKGTINYDKALADLKEKAHERFGNTVIIVVEEDADISKFTRAASIETINRVKDACRTLINHIILFSIDCPKELTEEDFNNVLKDVLNSYYKKDIAKEYTNSFKFTDNFGKLCKSIGVPTGAVRAVVSNQQINKDMTHVKELIAKVKEMSYINTSIKAIASEANISRKDTLAIISNNRIAAKKAKPNSVAAKITKRNISIAH